MTYDVTFQIEDGSTPVVMHRGLDYNTAIMAATAIMKSYGYENLCFGHFKQSGMCATLVSPEMDFNVSPQDIVKQPVVMVCEEGFVEENFNAESIH